MDKFIIHTTSSKQFSGIEDNNDLYELVEKNSHHKPSNKYQEWNTIEKEWTLSKFTDETQNFNLYKCSCNNEKRIHLINSITNNQVVVCENCINLFSHLKNTSDNIDNIVNYVLYDGMPVLINFSLMTFLNLDQQTVDKYNKNGVKNKRNIKIYTMLSKIGIYHHLHREYQDKLNSIYNKISRCVDVKEVVKKIDKCLENIKVCDKCEYLNQCLKCFKTNNECLEDITDEQFVALWKVYRHIFTDKKLRYGLYGLPGTGKTTVIKYILQINKLNEMFVLKELRDIFKIDYKNAVNEENIENRLKEFEKDKDIKNINTHIVEALYGEKIVVLASPTNKALDVIKEKVNSVKKFVQLDSFTGEINNLKVIFFTISKLMTYRRHLDSNHNMYFKRAKKYINIIDKYNLTIIDESSMISKENINDISDDISNSGKLLYHKGFILFTGDKAQLPPPKETISAVFKLDMYKVELQTVMRTDKQNIVGLSKFIRDWLFKPKDNIRKELLSYKCDYIYFYHNKEKFIDSYCDNIKGGKNGIILVWTNKTKNEYNKTIRDIIFDGLTKKKYMINEHLIFNNFYKLQTKVEDKFFYSSMSIIVRDIEINPAYICEKFDIDKIKVQINDKMTRDGNLISLFNENLYKNAITFINKFVGMFNSSMCDMFKVWTIYFIYKGKIETTPIYVIYNEKIYQKAITIGKKYIKDYFDTPNKLIFDEAKESIREIIINLFDEYFVCPFADISYGYCQTTDSAQGSTYECVYIDSPDMLDLTKYPFMDLSVSKRRFYTSLTRASEQVNILI